MPFDPFFSSSEKDEFHEKHQASRSAAKAFQFNKWTEKSSKQAKQVAIRHVISDRSAVVARKLRGTMVQAGGPGRPSLTGFKPPKKIFIHRNGRSPEGEIK